VIAGTDAKQHLGDVAPLRRVSAKPVMSKATGARMRLAQQSAPVLPGYSRERGAAVVATAIRRLRPHRAVAAGVLRSANPLILKAATASDRTDRKNWGSLYSVGTARALSVYVKGRSGRRPVPVFGLGRCRRPPMMKDKNEETPCSS
jgi:hypothetical protein